MTYVILDSGFVEIVEERDGLPWRAVITPGDESLARDMLSDEAETVIASWTPEQVEAAKPRPPFLPMSDMASLRATKQAEIRDAADAIMAAMGAEYGAFERETWPDQAAEAPLLLADPTVPAPTIRGIAAARGIDPLALAERIIRNRDNWRLISTSLVGQRQKLQDRLEALGEDATPEDVAAIVVAYSLPA